MGILPLDILTPAELWIRYLIGIILGARVVVGVLVVLSDVQNSDVRLTFRSRDKTLGTCHVTIVTCEVEQTVLEGRRSPSPLLRISVLFLPTCFLKNLFV